MKTSALYQQSAAIVSTIGFCIAVGCGSDDAAPSSSLPGAGGDAGSGGSGGKEAGADTSSGAGGLATGGTGGATAGHGGSGGSAGKDAGAGGAGGTKPDAGQDANPADSAKPDAPLAQRSGYVVLSTLWDSTGGLHATWARGAFFSGATNTPPACTTEAAGACTISDCPDELPSQANTLSAGTLSFSGGEFALANATPGTDGQYGVQSPYMYWYTSPPLLTIKASGAAFPGFEVVEQAPTFANFGGSPLVVSTVGATLRLHSGVDATLSWIHGAVGDTFVVEIFQGHTWDFRDIPLPNVARLQCPAELGTAVLPGSWAKKIHDANHPFLAYLAFTERRAQVEVAPQTTVTAVLRLGTIHAPFGEAYADTCTPDCSGKDCGSDGCGDTCGKCAAGTVCSSGNCIPTCTPSCAGKDCGSDGCTGSCGTCGSGKTCTNGLCVDSACDPVQNTGCAYAEGCWVLSTEQTTCAVPGTGTQGSSCSSTSGCAGGHGCFANVCRKICEVASSDGCTSSQTCTGVSGWVTYGACQ